MLLFRFTLLVKSGYHVADWLYWYKHCCLLCGFFSWIRGRVVKALSLDSEFDPLRKAFAVMKIVNQI